MRYGLVKMEAGGDTHLLVDRHSRTACEIARPQDGWPWQARGLVTIEWARDQHDVCRACLTREESQVELVSGRSERLRQGEMVLLIGGPQDGRVAVVSGRVPAVLLSEPRSQGLMDLELPEARWNETTEWYEL